MVETASNIWRDKLNPANPASADWKPKKAEIREWATWLENSAFTTTFSYRLWTELSAKTPSETGISGEVVADSGTHVDPVTSTTVPNNGRYTYTSSGWRWISALSTTILGDQINIIAAEQETLADEFLQVRSEFPDLTVQTGKRFALAEGISTTSDYYLPLWQQWSIAFSPEFAINDPAAFSCWMVFSEIPASIGVKVIKRPGVVGSTSLPGEHVDDEIFPFIYHDARDIVKDPKLAGSGIQQAVLPFSSYGALETGYIYFVLINAKNTSDSFINIGLSKGRVFSGVDPDWKKPLVYELTTTSPFYAEQMVGFSVFKTNWQEGSTGADSDFSKVISFGDLDRFQANSYDSTTWSVYLPKATIDYQPDPRSSEGSQGLVAVTKAGSGKTRYTAISMNRETGVFLVSNGSERTNGFNEYIPSTTGFTRVANAYVTPTGVELIPVYEFNNFVRRGDEARHFQLIRDMQLRIPKTMAKLRNGQPIRMVSYGDSITSAGLGEEDPYTPNGVKRDRLGYYPYYDATLLATIPLFDGDAGTNQHHHTSAEWILKENLENRYGSIIQYLNMGISGTHSGSGIDSGIGPHGTNPARMASVIALNPDFVNIKFGMNELGSASTYSNLVTLVNTFKSAGIEVILYTPCHPGDYNYFWASTDKWLYTCREVRKAAEDTNSAFVDFTNVIGPGNEGAFGLSKHSLCDANQVNHPGMYEHKLYGNYSSLLFG